MIDSEEIPEDILKEAERVLAGFKVTVSGEPQVTVFDYPQWRLMIAFSLLRERRRHEAQTPPPSTHVRVYPQELTDDLRFILSMMMWTTGPMAHALRDGGQDIKRKAEEEQAEVMHWLIGLALDHGILWRQKASDRIREIRAALATTEGQP